MLILFSLLTVVASNSVKINEQQSWKVVECPEKCQCSTRFSEYFQAHLRTVDCSGQDLLDFPSNLPSDVQVLLLKDNKIRRIFDKPLYLHDLVHLDLSHNLIRSLGYDSRFRELYNMKILDLSFNRLNALPDYVFRGLFNLEDLSLADNSLTTIGEESFKGLLKLETLRLTGNRLEYVNPSWWLNVRTIYNLYLDRNYFAFLQTESFKTLHHLRRLDLGRNKIARISDNAFFGLEKLEILFLDYNLLTAVPREALERVGSSLKSLYLNRNPVETLRTDDFANMNKLKDVSVNNMQRLKLVDRGSFKNLPELLVVEMHDNPYLNYLDESTFVNTPQITHILLHNNNLTALNRRIIDASSTLEEISFYGNPLACDCNSKWLKDYLTTNGFATYRKPVIFRDAERMVCDSPSDQKFKLFSVLQSTDLPDRCAPTIVQLFNESISRKTGDDVQLNCRAIGLPSPGVVWYDPNGTPITSGTFHPRRIVVNENTLLIRRVQPEDAGRYVCVAENDIGRSIVRTDLNVTSIQVQLVTTRITDTDVALRWDGVDLEHRVFQILYRPTAASNRHEYAGTVASVIKSYKLENLRSNTEYEACIAFKDDFDIVVHISCVNFRTKTSQSARVTIERTSNVAVGVALAIVASMLITLCLSAVFLRTRKYKGCPDRLTSLENGAYLAASRESVFRSYSTDNMVAPLVYNKLLSISNLHPAAHV